MVVLTCFVMSGCVCVCVCVCVYVCVGFVMCGCFGNMCTCTGCPNKSARFNFVIKHTIYSKSADIFISVQSTHTAINCGTQYLTNVPHDSAGTLLLI